MSAWSYHIRVCGFTFTFCTLDELREALAWFQQRVRPSSRLSKPPGWDDRNGEPWRQVLAAQHHEFQRWHERLPAGLTSESKRLRVVAALRKAIREFER